MTADVIIFPSQKRVGHARKIARTGVAMPEAWQRLQYWRKRVVDFRRRLKRIGADPEVIEAELAEFTALVRREAANLGGVVLEADDAHEGAQ